MAASNTSIAVIGCGHWGKNLVRNFAQLDALELVCDETEIGRERAREVATCYDAKYYTDYREMVRDPDIEAVDIVTEVDRHGEIGLAALEHDKHVFCEILVTASMEESDRLMEKTEASRAFFMEEPPFSPVKT